MLRNTLGNKLPYWRRNISSPFLTPSFVFPDILMTWQQRVIRSSRERRTSPALRFPTMVSISQWPNSCRPLTTCGRCSILSPRIRRFLRQWCFFGLSALYEEGDRYFDRNKAKGDIVVNRLCAEYNREHALKFGPATDGVRRKFVLQHFFFKIFEKRCGCR